VLPAGGDLPTVAERRRRSLAAEHRLFASACSRAPSVVLATAAPAPGVVLSRFVAALPQRSPRLPLAPAGASPALPPTAGITPVCPDGSLPLSASALDTYEDCPLRYAYTYALGVRGDAGLHAELGMLVHQVLARFLHPGDPAEPSLERLLALADDAWRDDIARYRPQQEEARRDYYEMLTQWWEGEGHQAGRDLEVLATERFFDVPVGPHRVSGRIDRIDRAASGGIRVVDYKTGRAKPKPDDVAANLQLATYHLAATRDPELSAWGAPTGLRLLYLRSMAAFDQDVTPDHTATTEARILEAADRILAEDFEPSVHADCDHCDFHRLCPLWPEGREVGAE
jgi:RecB family exonuclease